MRVLAAAVISLAALAAPAYAAAGRPVALVTAETANEVIALSLGPHGGKILQRVHLADPLMIAAPLRGPAVVVNPHGTVTLLAWHSLRLVKVFRGFRAPRVAEVAPGGRLAYVTDEQTGRLTVIDLRRRRIVGRVFVGLHAHHFGISPDGKRIWVALGETATTIVRVNAANPARPRVVRRLHPQSAAHDIGFEPDGRMVWITSATGSAVRLYSPVGQPLEGADGGSPPQHVAFSGRHVLLSSGYGSSLAELCWTPSCPRRVARVPYGSFNLATYRGFVVTTSLFTGQVTELRARDLHRLWTTKVAPAARYVAVSLWPGRRTASRTLSLGRGRVVRRLVLRQPDGGLASWRLVAPVGVRVVAEIRGSVPVTLDTRSPVCHRRRHETVCTALFENNLGPTPGLRWHVRLVKKGGPAARVRVELGVYPPRY